MAHFPPSMSGPLLTWFFYHSIDMHRYSEMSVPIYRLLYSVFSHLYTGYLPHHNISANKLS